MRATILGLALASLGCAALGTSASALPGPSAAGIAPENGIEKARMVSRTVVRGPFCKTVVTKRRGPMGASVVRKRVCR